MQTLRAAVQSHLMSDVPLGVFLSGGLDSGTIVALMHELGVSPDPHVHDRLRGEELQRDATRRARSRRATAPSTTS